MTLGERVKARRIEIGMSQEELAAAVGYKSRSSINKIELGQRDVPRTMIVQLANALGISPVDLLDDYEPKEISAPMDEKSALINQIIAKFAKLTPANQQIVLDLIDTMLNNEK